MTCRYVYLGDGFTDPKLLNQPCDPVRKPDGKCVRSFATGGPRSQLVVFADGVERVVLARRLRLVKGA